MRAAKSILACLISMLPMGVLYCPALEAQGASTFPYGIVKTGIVYNRGYARSNLPEGRRI